jgi:hypothetical protein
MGKVSMNSPSGGVGIVAKNGVLRHCLPQKCLIRFSSARDIDALGALSDSGECLNPGGTVTTSGPCLWGNCPTASFAGICVGRTSEVDTFCLKNAEHMRIG